MTYLMGSSRRNDGEVVVSEVLTMVGVFTSEGSWVLEERPLDSSLVGSSAATAVTKANKPKEMCMITPA